jgi:dTMP kinase
MSKGKFIVFEGLDGAGKTSCVDALKRDLSDEIIFTHEPYLEDIRALLKKEPLDGLATLLLFAADRRVHMRKVIIPALEAGKHVVCDRFMGSTYAYQIVAGGQRDREEFFWTLHKEILGAYIPDHYFFVTISPEKARERMEKRMSMDHFEKNLAFQAKVREGYELFLKNVSHTRIDGGVELSIMQKEVVRLVKELLSS